MNLETAKPPVLTNPVASSSSAGRILRVLGLAAVAVVAVMIAWTAYSEATRKDTTEDYMFMCEGLFQDLPVNGVPTVKASDAEVEARVQEVTDRFWYIVKHGRKLVPIAKKYIDIVDRAKKIQGSAPGLSPVVFGSAEAILGIYVGQREVVSEGGQRVLQGTEKLVDAFGEVIMEMNDRHVLAIQLSDLAPAFSGPETNTVQFTCSFVEQKVGFLNLRTQDSLMLTNSSGQELHNCLVAVRLSDISGNSYLNLHFIPDWQINEVRVANYSNLDFPKDTVDGTVRVDVSIHAKEYSVPTITIREPESGWHTPE